MDKYFISDDKIYLCEDNDTKNIIRIYCVDDNGKKLFSFGTINKMFINELYDNYKQASQKLKKQLQEKYDTYKKQMQSVNDLITFCIEHANEISANEIEKTVAIEMSEHFCNETTIGQYTAQRIDNGEVVQGNLIYTKENPFVYILTKENSNKKIVDENGNCQCNLIRVMLYFINSEGVITNRRLTTPSNISKVRYEIYLSFVVLIYISKRNKKDTSPYRTNAENYV